MADAAKNNKLRSMKNLILTLGIAILLMSCNQSKNGVVNDNLSYTTNEKTAIINPFEDEGYLLLKNNCYACHNPNSASHDEIIAPPFKAVKMHYMKEYGTQKEFVDAVVDWVQNPNDGKSLMKGAVNKFQLMPKLAMDQKDLKKIATYLYENDVEEPVWMGDHMKEMKGKGMGKGKSSCKGKNCGGNCKGNGNGKS